jgi:transposase
MPKPLPVEFRRKVVDAYNAGDGTMKALAQRFCISFNSVVRWIDFDRFTGDISPKPHRGGVPPKIPDEILPLLRALVEEKPDRTLAELAEIWSTRFKCEVRRTTISVALQRAGLSLKKRLFGLPNAT